MFLYPSWHVLEPVFCLFYVFGPLLCLKTFPSGYDVISFQLFRILSKFHHPIFSSSCSMYPADTLDVVSVVQGSKTTLWSCWQVSWNSSYAACFYAVQKIGARYQFKLTVNLTSLEMWCRQSVKITCYRHKSACLWQCWMKLMRLEMRRCKFSELNKEY